MMAGSTFYGTFHKLTKNIKSIFTLSEHTSNQFTNPRTNTSKQIDTSELIFP